MANMIGTIGADVLFATTASDSITGGGGNDFIIGVPAAGIGASSIAYGNNTIVTGTGNSTIVAGGNSTVTTGLGNAAVILGFADIATGNEMVNLGVGNNIVLSVSGNNTINGGGFGALDLIVAGSGRDVVIAKTNELMVAQAGSGNQLLDASKAFASILIGGTGNDTMLGGTSSNTITAGTGADSILGGAGNDLITVNLLTKFAVGGGGNDTVLLTGTGPTLTNIDLNVLANQNATSAVGAPIGPVLQGFRNVDASASSIGVAITGDNNGDRLVGARGASTITGGTGNDFILGGAANDVISVSKVGFSGDTVNGGGGTNTLLLNGGLSNATINGASLGSYSNIQTLAVGAIGTGDSIVLTDALIRQLSGTTSLRFDLASATNFSGGALGGGQITLDLSGVTAASSLSFNDPNGLIAGFRVTNPNGVVLPIAPVVTSPGPVVVPTVIPVPAAGFVLLGATSTGLTAPQALNVVNPSDNAGATISTTGLAATLTLYNPAGSASAANLLINGVPTLNVVSNTLLADTLGFSASTTGLSHLNLTGVAPITVNPGVTGAQIDVLDASGLGPTGNLTLTAGLTKTGAVLTGSNGGDTYTGGTLAAGIAQYNGGTGNDLMKMTSLQIEGANGIGNAFNGGGGLNTLEVTDTGGVQVSLTDVAGQFTNLQNVRAIVIDTNFGVTMTTGTNFNTNFAVGGVAITALNLGTFAATPSSVFDLSPFTGAANITARTLSTTGGVSITGGSGADTVTVTADALTTGHVVVTTGNVADVITIRSLAPGFANVGGVTSEFVINPGAGADTINLFVSPSTASAGNYVEINVAAAANSPTSGFKVVNGIHIADGTTRLSDEIAFGSAPVAHGAVGATPIAGGFNGGTLSYSIINTGTVQGQLTFTSGNGSALQASDVITFYNNTIAPSFVTASATNQLVFWDDGTASHNTYLFDHYSAGSDALIELVGAHVLSLTATTTMTTPGYLVVI